MAPQQLASALRHLCRSAARPGAGGLSDAQLLQRFLGQRDEGAFELLIWRHGPMVLGLCRRLLRHEQDAEDAFQATLLALARKAGSIDRGGSVGSWLYKVAYRVALRARAGALRRARREMAVADLPALADRRGLADAARRELGSVLDEELSRLPEKYRAPVVLCYLQGLTNEDAARRLRWPVGTLKTRLARARRLLGGRLARRGLALGAGLAAAGEFPGPAAVPQALAGSTARAAALVAAADVAAANAVSPQVARLTEGVLRAMTLMKLKVAAVALAVTLTLAGGGVVSYRALAADPAGGAGVGPARVPEEGAAARVARLKKRIGDLQQELRLAEEAAARKAAPPSPVAVIFGDIPITRAELGDHLIRRLKPEQLQAYINERILEHACRAKGVNVSEQEVGAAYEADRRACDRAPEGFEEFLRQQHKTVAEWKEDVIRPRLQLRKLCRERVQITEQDLRDAYEADYGEKVECQVILWPAAENEKAERLYPTLVENEARFQQAAGTQPTHALATTDGHIPPFGRHSTGNEKLEKAAFALRPGEFSPLLETPEGIMLLKCLKRIPADRSRRLEEERGTLRQEVMDRRYQKEAQELFQELQEQARPRVLWRPEGAGQGTPP
jgi:RNA polymerase sigma factor (sigma-70 family)